jgi:hypothetical protein
MQLGSFLICTLDLGSNWEGTTQTNHVWKKKRIHTEAKQKLTAPCKHASVLNEYRARHLFLSHTSPAKRSDGTPGLESGHTYFGNAWGLLTWYANTSVIHRFFLQRGTLLWSTWWNSDMVKLLMQNSSCHKHPQKRWPWEASCFVWKFINKPCHKICKLYFKDPQQQATEVAEPLVKMSESRKTLEKHFPLSEL